MNAQRSSMKQKLSPPTSLYRPARVRELFRSTKLALEQFHQREISFEELGRYSAQAGSTVFEKLQKDEHPQVEAILGWLEHLPEDVRGRLINGVCRAFPHLEDRRLGHNPGQVSSLRSLLKQPVGLTLIIGNDGLRTWLTSALGNSSLMLGRDHRLVSGIDRSLPDWFVPVEGITYLNAPLPELPSPESILKAWSTCTAGERKVVLLNGIITLKPDLRLEVLKLAAQRNVFVAETDVLACEWFAKHAPAAVQPRRLKVSLEDRDRIHVQFENSKTTARK
ncbi:MAG: hypothetical protein P4N59_31475 [Negativicutes bacterium]|nr:hypothetical protein [Negativicutes bacterium]